MYVAKFQVPSGGFEVIADDECSGPVVGKVHTIKYSHKLKTSSPSGPISGHQRDFELDRVHHRVQRGLPRRVRLPAHLLRARAQSLWAVRVQQSGEITRLKGGPQVA